MKIKHKLNIQCWNPKCKDFRKIFTGKIKIAKTYTVFNGTVRRKVYQCDSCGKYFSETYGTLFYYRKKKPEVIESVLDHLVRGNGVRDTGELVHISKDTVEDLIITIGFHICQWYSSQEICLPKGHIEYDEMWTFVLKKESDLLFEGETWIWISFHRESRFFITFVAGKRTLDNALDLMRDTKPLINKESKHCSDELPCYANAIKQVFGELVVPQKTQKRGRPKQPYYKAPENLNYGTVHKTREKGTIVDISKVNVYGKMDENEISTTKIERNNLNIRQDNGRTSRKKLTFSKDITYLIASFFIYLYYYNYMRPHLSLRKRNPDYEPGSCQVKWIKFTPAMEVSLCDKPLAWSDVLNWKPEFG